MTTVDFHTHVFPDKIAHSSITALEKSANTTAFLDGTEQGLKSDIIKAGVSIAVALPVLTKPTQFDSVFNYALSLNSKFNPSLGANILSFAGVHPDLDDVENKLQKVKDAGFLGVKIHPDYQGVFIDDERYVNIVKKAKELGLIVVTHAGVDDGFLDMPVRCTPKRALNLLDKVGGYDKMVFAHLGGNRMFDEVLSLLAGKDVYFDTGFSLDQVTDKQFLQLVKKHGANKILFATDSPWRDISTEKARVMAMDLTEEEKELILCKNALKLLNLENYYDK